MNIQLRSYISSLCLLFQMFKYKIKITDARMAWIEKTLKSCRIAQWALGSHPSLKKQYRFKKISVAFAVEIK